MEQEAFARELEIAQRKEREKIFSEKKVQRDQRKGGGEGGSGGVGGAGVHQSRGGHHKPKPPSEGAAVKFDPKSMGIVGIGTRR